MMERQPILYFLTDGNGFVKIGLSYDILSDLAEWQKWNPRKLTLLYSGTSSEDELKQVYVEFSDLWFEGLWYKNDRRIADKINLLYGIANNV